MRVSVGLTGRKRSGKDTAASALIRDAGYTRIGFADALKRSAVTLNPWVSPDLRLADAVAERGWEDAKDQLPEVRRILQVLGDECGRRVHGEGTWVQTAMAQITRHRLAGRPVVVPDVRYANEADVLRAAGFVLVRIVRAGTTSDDGHASETGIDQLPVDYELSNDGTAGDLGKEMWSTLSSGSQWGYR